MKIRAVGKLVPDWYIPIFEKDESVPAQFLLKPLRDIEKLEMSEKVVTDKDNNMILSAGLCRVIIGYGLVDWKNFLDENDEPVKFSGSMERNIGMLPTEVIQDLAAEILQRTYVPSDDKKKS